MRIDATSRPLRRGVALGAVLFDMDGVVLDTARLHAAAWKETFDAFLADRARRSGQAFRPFDATRDYLRYVDGRPRFDGVREFLDARGIDMPWGEAADPPTRESICGLGNRKNALFRARLAQEPIHPFPGTLRLIRALRAAGIAVAVFSASRNAADVLERAGASSLFDLRMDGRDLEARSLPGKPDAAMLLAAAEGLGQAPARCAVIEDSVAGIEAAIRGGFAQAIGVDRGGNAAALHAAGATAIVEDCGEIALDGGCLAPRRLASLPPVWGATEILHERLARAEPVVFLDYDGTLTPIVPDPDKALLAPAMREAIATLARRCRVAVVSGRDLAVIRDLVGLPDLIYAGSHGFEAAGPGGARLDLEIGRDFLPALDAAEATLRKRLAGIPGHLVERQRFAMAVHYRNAAAADAPRIEAVLDGVLAEVGGLRKGSGKKVFRVQPAIDWDKGRAVAWLLERLGTGQAALPVYIGDDVTDEDAFRAIAYRGLPIAVRGEQDRLTSAEYALKDTEDVRRFLGVLADRAP